VAKDGGAARERLLEAALGQFALKGYGGATVDDIAAAAGLSKGAVYWHYKDKRELFRSVIADRARQLVEHVRATAAQGTPLRRLVDMTRAVLQYYEENRDFAAIRVYLRIGEDGAVDAEADAALREWYRDSRARLAELVRQGIALGEIRPCPPEGTATALLAVLDGLVFQWIIDPDQVSLCAAHETLAQTFFRGLAAAEGLKPQMSTEGLAGTRETRQIENAKTLK
jgi:TetR/AcrR family transcriptional regulator, acrAB operon repressor